MIQFKDGTTNEDAVDFVDLDRLEKVIQGKDLKVTIGRWQVIVEGKSDDILSVEDDIESCFNAAIEEEDHEKGKVDWSLC